MAARKKGKRGKRDGRGKTGVKVKIALISTNEGLTEHGLRTISSCLRDSGFETRMFFMPNSNYYEVGKYPQKSLDQLEALVKDCGIICFSSMSACNARTLQAIRHLRKKLHAFFVWGGIHATLSPETCIQEVDAVGIGECEEAIVELAKKIQGGKKYLDTKNFWFNKGGKITKNGIRRLVEDLDVLPFPDYELETQYVLKNGDFFCAADYFKENSWELYRGMAICFSARGCPHSCTYCSNNLRNRMQLGKGKIIRTRSIDKFIDELKYLKGKFPDIKEFRITDDVFLVRSDEELEHFSERYKKEIGLPFRCNSTPRLVTEKKIRMLADAGLNCVMIGVQTGSERINRDIYKRHYTNEMAIEASKVLKKCKIRRGQYHFIVSNPFEEKEDVLGTISLMQKLEPPCETAVFNLALFPKTEIKEMIEKEKFAEKPEEHMSIEFSDHLAYMKFEKKNKYLNTMVRCMGGAVTGIRIGRMPRFMVKPLIKMHGTPLEKLGYAYLYSTLLVISTVNHSYYKLSPKLPKRVRVGIIEFMRKYNIR